MTRKERIWEYISRSIVEAKKNGDYVCIIKATPDFTSPMIMDVLGHAEISFRYQDDTFTIFIQ